jgi:hypothetical protein
MSRWRASRTDFGQQYQICSPLTASHALRCKNCLYTARSPRAWSARTRWASRIDTDRGQVDEPPHADLLAGAQQCQVAINGPAFSYSAKPDFQGQDDLTLQVGRDGQELRSIGDTQCHSVRKIGGAGFRTCAGATATDIPRTSVIPRYEPVQPPGSGRPFEFTCISMRMWRR